jgi:predicted amidohydrolase
MSLSGSVEPTTRPDRLLDLHGPHTRAVVASTAETGVACCFGLAERHDDGPFITQVIAAGGEIVAVQRKGLLGEDEAGFACAPTLERAVWGRFSVAICAEGGFDPAWEAGTDVVLFCAAPGLDDDMATGVAWWDGYGVGQARHHAARRGVWVALSTQWGTTEDEDFPGIAALVSPDGEVVAKAMDGVLVVEVP